MSSAVDLREMGADMHQGYAESHIGAGTRAVDGAGWWGILRVAGGSWIVGMLLWAGCGGADLGSSAGDEMRDSLQGVSLSPTAECIHRDTLTPMGTRIRYLQDGDNFRLAWGDGSYQRVHDSTFTCFYDPGTGTWDFVPDLVSETAHYLVLENTLYTSSGGNPMPIAFYAVICPKDADSPILERDFLLGWEGDFVWFGDPDPARLHLVDLERGEEREILLSPAPPRGRTPGVGILDSWMEGGELVVRY